MFYKIKKDKIAAVTGWTRTIGFAITREFAENNGSTTIVCSRIKRQVAKAAEQVKSPNLSRNEECTYDDRQVKGRFTTYDRRT